MMGIDLSEARALTLRNPYAYAVTDCGKTIENRGFRPHNPPKLLLIHAGRDYDFDGNAELVARGFRPPTPDMLVKAAIVAVAALESVCTDSYDDPHIGCSCGPWAREGAIHWLLGDVVVLDEPVPCRGRLSLWKPPAGVLDAVAKQVP